VDDPTFDTSPGRVPLLVVDDAAPGPGVAVLVANEGETNGIAAEIQRRLARNEQSRRRFARSSSAGGPNGVSAGGAAAEEE
jgi:hypothetical protein